MWLENVVLISLELLDDSFTGKQIIITDSILKVAIEILSQYCS